MGHNRNLADYAHHFDGTNIDLGSGNIETEGVLTYEDVTNVDSVGIITARAGVKVPDSQNISLGTGNDFAITHDGTNTTFINDTGQIQIRNRADDQDIILQTDDGSGGVAVYLRCDGSSGQVDLNHYGSRKFYTSSTGATVNGTLVSDGVTSELDLSAISASISDTAVDVFVYDTRKDSDGGAWRKRTQHTSWYNETLNTSTRGSRKEFPAVAIIVMQEGTLTIYDGDDPDLPMWMVFTDNNDTGSLFASAKMLSCRTATSIFMLNGIFVCGGRGAYHDGVTEINFLTDSAKKYMNNGYYYNSLNISQRESTGGYYTVTSGTPSIANNLIRDLAMTVLPNARVDVATGLPVPTIAVGNDNGVSIIRDDGSIVDLTITTGSNNDGERVDFTDDNRVVIQWSGDSAGEITIDEIPSVDTSATYPINLPGSHYNDNSPASYSPCFLTEGPSISNRHPTAISQFRAVGTTAALSVFEENKESEEDGMVAFISSSYNTGYQQGRIKGAFLSDTDTTNAVAAYYDDFANNDNGWGFVDCSISGGNLVITQQSQARATDGDALSHVSTGVKLVFTFTVSGSGTGSVLLDDDGAGAGVGGNTNYGSFNSTGSYTFTVTKTASPRLRFIRNSGSNDYNINFLNISTEYDRSLNNKGLGVYGTITKSAVATGADLVAYSGFSASNHLAQSYNSDLNPGSGSYSVVAWFKTESNNSGEGAITGLGNGDSDEVMLIYVNSSYGIYFDYGTSTEYVYLSNSNDRSMVRDGNWHQVVCQVTSGQIGEIYIDGIKKSTAQNVAAPSTWSQWDTNYRLYVGCARGLGTLPFSGSISLVRYSLSKMSTEQIKKMYEDEKHLFVENAKATLYGSSDAVTALAYDEDTELLHVGTSSGRSDFQGLRRINNTTTAVTTAISASDELIAEQ